MIGTAVLVRHASHLSLAAINRLNEDGTADLKELVPDASGCLAVRETLGVQQGPGVGQWFVAPWQERELIAAIEDEPIELEFDDDIASIRVIPGEVPAPAPAPTAVTRSSVAAFGSWVVISW